MIIKGILVYNSIQWYCRVYQAITWYSIVSGVLIQDRYPDFGSELDWTRLTDQTDWFTSHYLVWSWYSMVFNGLQKCSMVFHSKSTFTASCAPSFLFCLSFLFSPFPLFSSAACLASPCDAVAFFFLPSSGQQHLQEKMILRGSDQEGVKSKMNCSDLLL